MLAAWSADDWTHVLDRVLQIITALGVILSLLLGRWRGQKLFQQNQGLFQQGEDAKQTTLAVAEVLAVKTDQQTARLENAVVQSVKEGPLTHALKSNVVLAEKVADLTGLPSDARAAETSRKVSDNHEAAMKEAKG